MFIAISSYACVKRCHFIIVFLIITANHCLVVCSRLASVQCNRNINVRALLCEYLVWYEFPFELSESAYLRLPVKLDAASINSRQRVSALCVSVCLCIVPRPIAVSTE